MNVAAIVPAMVGRRAAGHGVRQLDCHGLGPLGLADGREAVVLRLAHTVVLVVALHGVAAVTDRARHLGELAADVAVSDGRQAIRRPRHFARATERTRDGFGLGQVHDAGPVSACSRAASAASRALSKELKKAMVYSSFQNQMKISMKWIGIRFTILLHKPNH